MPNLPGGHDNIHKEGTFLNEPYASLFPQPQAD